MSDCIFCKIGAEKFPAKLAYQDTICLPLTTLRRKLQRTFSSARVNMSQLLTMPRPMTPRGSDERCSLPKNWPRSAVSLAAIAP